MPKTALELTPQEWQMYQPARSIETRRRTEKQLVEQRKHRAWQIAREAARILRTEFDAHKIVVFGSLAHRGWFTRWSDIDLAVWGILPEQFYRAVASVVDLSQDFKIDLVDMETCSQSLRATIEQEGIEL